MDRSSKKTCIICEYDTFFYTISYNQHRYQSVVAGEVNAESSDDEVGDQIDSAKKIEHCREIGELKAQWESGRVNNENGFTTVDISANIY